MSIEYSNNDLNDANEIEKIGDDLFNKIKKGPEMLKELYNQENLQDAKNLNNNISYISTKNNINKNNTSCNIENRFNSKATSKVEKLLKKYNNEYLKNLKESEKLNTNNFTSNNNKFNNLIQEEFEKVSKEVNKIKIVNREEELLRMQKKNEEIELELLNLKNQDKSKLHDKEEESKKLVEELNETFKEKMKEAYAKDKERKAAIEEIKQIQKQQDDLNFQIEDNNKKLFDLKNEVEVLEKQVEKYETYKQFIDEVIKKSNEGNSNKNSDYDKLKEQFENLIYNMNNIKQDIEKQELEIKEKKAEQNYLLKTDEKQSQNQKVAKLEEEAKLLAKENESLEKDIEEIMKKNQNKESENHQIMLSIINLHLKVKKNKKIVDYDTENMKESTLCEYLSEISDNLNDLIAICNDSEINKNK